MGKANIAYGLHQRTLERQKGSELLTVWTVATKELPGDSTEGPGKVVRGQVCRGGQVGRAGGALTWRLSQARRG